jgi:hypothetical protein
MEIGNKIRALRQKKGDLVSSNSLKLQSCPRELSAK